MKRGEPVDGVTFEDARPVLRAVSENVMLEIQKTFDFFKATASSDRIDRIVVSGGASRAEGFLEMLGERFDAPVELFDPFKRVAFDAKRFQVDDVDDVARDGGGGGGPGLATGGGPMIRINLLAVERERARKRVLIPAAHRVTAGATMILLGTAVARSAGGSGRSARSRSASTKTWRAPRARRGRSARSWSRCGSSSRSAPCCSSASR